MHKGWILMKLMNTRRNCKNVNVIWWIWISRNWFFRHKSKKRRTKKIKMKISNSKITIMNRYKRLQWSLSRWGRSLARRTSTSSWTWNWNSTKQRCSTHVLLYNNKFVKTTQITTRWLRSDNGYKKRSINSRK